MSYDWKFENSINQTKEYQEVDSEYSSWRTNACLANHVDTVLFSNMMNLNPHLDDKLQYDYLFHSIRQKKRFFKRDKPINNDNFKLVMDYYKYNAERTKEALSVLSQEQIEIIKKKQKGE